jgi:hypothetical protein
MKTNPRTPRRQRMDRFKKDPHQHRNLLHSISIYYMQPCSKLRLRYELLYFVSFGFFKLEETQQGVAVIPRAPRSKNGESVQVTNRDDISLGAFFRWSKPFIHGEVMLTDQPNILAIIRRDGKGKLEQLTDPVQFHREPMLTIIPNGKGVYVFLGLLDEQDNTSLSQLLSQLRSQPTSQMTVH